MGSIGPAEILVVLVLALVVLGPTRLPDAARSLGKALGEFRRVSAGLQAEVRDAFAEPQPAAAAPVIQADTAPPPTLPPLSDGSTPPDLGDTPYTVSWATPNTEISDLTEAVAPATPEAVDSAPALPTPVDLDPTVAAPMDASVDLDPTVASPAPTSAPVTAPATESADLDPTVIEWEAADAAPVAPATPTPPGDSTDGPIRPG